MITPFSPQTNPSSLVVTLSNTSSLVHTASSSCSSPQFADACSISTDASQNILLTFASITFTDTNTNYIHFQLNNVRITSPSTLTATALFNINGNPALSSATSASINPMYS